ncbi:DapH/DapD/GlmU-related protein [Flavobacterium salmonis]|uniref:Putative colanic acid biosynthesis acetyltransferase n=1 Tax=Flavobacterium salmonis TaxID=2654844 RepID=A0A6V6YYX0_9FLAO|nr:DapH/DapD/GlmU-related protein [Flavobacterium salmonis]CAD0004605.1 putative colanic acid biosynthesis acetyltransferase [Flavobacterium salmonis]
MENNKIDLSQYKNTFSRKNKIARLLWTIIWTIFARPLPRSFGNSWKIFLLRLFGAKIHKKAVIYSTVRIYMPWNLEMDAYSCLAPEVDCYNVDKIKIGANSTVSQKAYLCGASHDITLTRNPLIHAPIIIEDQVWIGADAYLGMGITIKRGSVVGARACVYKDVESWTVVGGNPAKFIKKRIFENE